MTTGYNWKKLQLVNFGEENINLCEEFTQLTNVLSDQIFFEAIRSLLDHNYVNEKVTKRRNTVDDSFVELTYKRKGREYILKRVFGDNVRIFLNGKVIKQIPQDLTSNLEAYYETPTHLANHMVSQLFRRKMVSESNLTNCLQNVRLSDEYDPMTITLEERDNIENELHEDLRLHGKIEKYKWKWIMSRQNRIDDSTYYEEADTIFPTNPIDEFHFRNSLVNICLAPLQFDIAVNQRDLFNRFIKVVDSQEKAYAIDYALPQSWERVQKAIAISTKVEQHDEKLLDFYKADINIVSKYKEDFQTANEWEMEKENMNMSEETRFQDELKNEESDLKDAAEVIRDKINDTVTTIEETRYPDLGTMSWNVLHLLTPFIFDNVMESLNVFSEDLCEVLNNPLLQTANISNGIAGSVDYITNNAGAARKPEFIFDHVSSSDGESSKHLFDLLQTYLAPLSNFQLAKTTDDVLEFLEKIEQEENDESSATRFIFAALDNVEPGAAPAAAGSRTLTNIRRKFSYDACMNLLTNFLITRDKKSDAKKSNLLNLATKTISLANNEKTFVTESENLFQLLRAIKGIYQSIGDYLLDAKRFEQEWIREADILTSFLTDNYYINESLLRSHLMNLMSLIFDQRSVTHQEQAIKSLTYRSTSRMTIYEQLLSLQHADGCDDSTFVETLSQRNADTLDVELCEINLSEKLTFRNPGECKVLYDYIEYFRGQLSACKNDFIRVHTMWQQTCEDLLVEVNDELAKRLSTIYNIDFALWGHNFKKILLRRNIPRQHCVNNNLRCEDIFGQIDIYESQLHYPMASTAKLNACLKVLKSAEKNRDNTRNVIAMIASLFSRYGNLIDETLHSLCARLTDANEHNEGFIVNCCFLKARYATVDCQEFAQQVHIYGKDGEDDFVAVAMYAFFIRQFTESPIIINEVAEACEPITLENVVSFIEAIVFDRLALVRDPYPLGPNDASNDNHNPTSRSNLHPSDNGNRFGPQDGAQRSDAMDIDDNYTAEGFETGRRRDTDGGNLDTDDDQNQRDLQPAESSRSTRNGVPQTTTHPRPEQLQCTTCRPVRLSSKVCLDCGQNCCESCEASHHPGHYVI